MKSVSERSIQSSAPPALRASSIARRNDGAACTSTSPETATTERWPTVWRVKRAVPSMKGSRGGLGAGRLIGRSVYRSRRLMRALRYAP